LGVIDKIPLSKFRQLKPLDQAWLMSEAFRAKGNYVRASKYMQKVLELRIGDEGICKMVAKKAAGKLMEAYQRWNGRTYVYFWAAYGPEDLEEINSPSYALDGIYAQFYHKIDWIVINKDEKSGLFVLREQIDGSAFGNEGGRQFKCSAFRVESDGTINIVATDTAWEKWEGRAGFKLVDIRDNKIILRPRDGFGNEIEV
jgi:hypothetical protein